MNINFTGIQNIGYKVQDYQVENSRTYKQKCDEHFINLQLTNDENGNDLTEFKNKLATSDIASNINYNHPDYLNIIFSKETIIDYDDKSTDLNIIINDEDELEVNDRNLPLLSHIAKLLTRISQSDDDQFMITKEYLENDAATAIIPGENLEDEYGNDYFYKIVQDHSPKTVKQGATKMSEILTERMIDYFS